MKSFNSPVFKKKKLSIYFVGGIYMFDYFIFTESLSTPKLI